MHLGENIKNYRRIAKMTQEQLAQKCGVATITIRQYENEKRQPRMEVLEKIADALGVSMDVLYGIPKEADGYRYYYYYYYDEDSVEPAFQKLLNDTMLKAFQKLNTSGQQVAIQRVEELTEIPKYQREPENSAKKELPPAANRKQPEDE